MENLNIISNEILEKLNNDSIIIEKSELQRDNKLLLITTKFLDSSNDLIEILLYIEANNIFLCDNWLINNEFSLFFDNETILNNIHKQCLNFPINQQFVYDDFLGIKNRRLICETNIEQLENDFLYFCQSIIKHLDLIKSYVIILGD